MIGPWIGERFEFVEDPSTEVSRYQVPDPFTGSLLFDLGP